MSKEMQHSVDELWDFFRANGAHKVRTTTNHFEILLKDGRVFGTPEFISHLTARLGPIPKRNKFGGFLPPKRPPHWSSNPTNQPKPRYIHSEEDRLIADEIKRQRRILRAYGREFKILHNLVRFGVESVPPDLLISNEGDDIAPTKPRTKKEVELYYAKQEIIKRLESKEEQKNQIELCREYLRKHTIKGKKGYTAEKLSNNISQTRKQ